ncbi:double-stranded RNA-specific editase 1-like isoform X2 [Acanthaster planci]|uniref:Double-stranded RNA-specific editase 1-like isoform X2 n=1 Tax=Acanthaster planci TaxID=133434 RepID=A0A8B7XWM9_ACAPL|nr:double-stranded RNA-specific editase 1-like isoform X2 [Acanthaster planci]
MANCKTAVSILQEHCARQGMTPIYNTISQEGLSHQPKFTINCTAGQTVGTGEGVSKKSAKQAAAEAVLQQWEVEIPKLDSVKAETVDPPNPVGQLQELVTFLGWRRPEYDEIEETGPPHDRSFVIGVTVGKFKEQGTDKSKRLAKRTAAKAMLEKIKALPPDTDPGIEPGTTKSKKKQAADAPAAKATGCSLQFAVGQNIDRLRNNPLNFPDAQSCQILQLIAVEQNFATRYIDLPEPGPNNQYQCLVELQTSPLAVCHGTGQRLDSAHATAARNALYYIKMMAQKPPDALIDIKDEFEPPSHKNPVQMLNEMTVTPLDFSMVDKSGPPHEPVYVMSIQLDGQIFTAEGKKKKEAKEAIARKALLTVFGIKSPDNDGLLYARTRPTPSVLYSTWSAQKALICANLIQNLIEAKLREVTLNDGQHRYLKYKVLAGIVQSDGEAVESLKVVCLATGTKCPLAEEPHTKGTIIHDCHAEVIARRCLKRYLMEQLLEYQKNPRSSVFDGGISGILQLKEGIRFHLYISCPPCGDASSFIKEERNMGHNDVHPGRGARGILRAKIKQGESTIPLTGKATAAPERLFTMTCSDKVASWNVLGIQGALLSHLIAPVYLSSVVLGMQYHPDHLPRALYGRLTDLPDLPRGYKLNKPLMVGTSRPSQCPFGASPVAKAPNFSINWIIDLDNIEVIKTDKGLKEDGSSSRVSQEKLFSTYMVIMNKFPSSKGQTTGGSIKQSPQRGSSSKKDKQGKGNVSKEKPQQNFKVGNTYREVKEKAEAYQECKKILKATFLSEGLGRWLERPKECDNFSIVPDQ